MKTLSGFRLLLATPFLFGIPVRAFNEAHVNVRTLASSSRLFLLKLGSEQKTGSSAPSASTLFRRGTQALQNGRLAEAETDFRGVIALDPKSSAPHVNLGVAFMREKRWDDALVELRKAESLSPDEPGIPLNMGLAYFRKNDFASAIGPLTQTLQREPHSLQARYLLGLSYFFMNDYIEATDTLAPLWEVDSDKLSYLYVLSIAARKGSNPLLQKQAIERMIAIGQNTPELHLYLGKAMLAEGNNHQALKEFQAAASTQPNLPLVHYFLGRTYLEQHAYPQAESEFEKDVAIEPDFPYNYEDLANVYVQLNQPHKAELYYRHAIERDKTLVNSAVFKMLIC